MKASPPEGPTDPLAAIEAPSTEAGALEMVATLRGATALWLLIVRQRATTRQIADALGVTPRHARRIMAHLELSRRFVILYCRPYWILRRRDERDA